MSRVKSKPIFPVESHNRIIEQFRPAGPNGDGIPDRDDLGGGPAAAAATAARVLVGLNFYGNDYSLGKPDAHRTLMGADYLRLLAEQRPRKIHWDEQARSSLLLLSLTLVVLMLPHVALSQLRRVDRLKACMSHSALIKVSLE